MFYPLEKMLERIAAAVLLIEIVTIISTATANPSPSDELYFKPFNVSYDHRALIIDGKRRMLISAGIHYPRATPEMWPDLISKSKEGGAEVIQTYVFWNGHEPVRGHFNFEGRYDIVKFVRTVASYGLYLHLRIGPYVCAEWNFGGFPVWLRDIPGIEFRTDNQPFKDEMQRFVKKIVNLMRDEMLFSWQGGPIIMLQIENEYGNIQGSYGEKGKSYVKWAAQMALGLDAGVPWVMCQQSDAPGTIIDTCNGFYCDGYKPNSYNKPTMWTEDWNGWKKYIFELGSSLGSTKTDAVIWCFDIFQKIGYWGSDDICLDPGLHHGVGSCLKDPLTFAVARFFQRGGSYHNYYMYFGGTNFGRTSGGPFYITSYDYDAPIDEYGLLSQPKWGHLKDLHAAIKLCEPALVAVSSPKYIKLGPLQEAHVYEENIHADGTHSTHPVSKGNCAAFLANIDEHRTATITFRGQQYTIPPWSVSVLPDCSNTAFNTAKVGSQTSVKLVETDRELAQRDGAHRPVLIHNDIPFTSRSWMMVKEPFSLWSQNNFTVSGILEHLNVTKDISDYLWHFTSVYVTEDDVSFWEENDVSPAITIDSMRDVVHVFVNGKLEGTVVGHWIKVVQTLSFVRGHNDLVLLTQTVGLQNSGPFLEKDGAGFRGEVKLTGFKSGEVDLLESLWTYQVGLKGEFLKIYTPDEDEKAGWTPLTPVSNQTGFTWYKTHFDAPNGTNPVALDLGSMGKGQAWVNGHHIGRYWTLVAPKDGCRDTCDYRGAYNSDKCAINCGKPTQIWYHVPRSWLQPSDNLLVLFEETGGNPFAIQIKTRSTGIICAQVSESHYPPLHKWSSQYFINGKILKYDMTREMQLQCEDGDTISSIEFASYGSPQGSCQKFNRGKCHSSSSNALVSEACVGKRNCTIKISNDALGGDPCHGVVKTLAVQARCVPWSNVKYSAT